VSTGLGNSRKSLNLIKINLGLKKPLKIGAGLKNAGISSQ
jgi:hypothetical protein